MANEDARKSFDLYNRASDVVRCPYGRGSIRKQLDDYAKAAVNLYGIIKGEDLVDIFNKQNTDQTTKEEIYILLLPLVLKEGWYCFYKEYIVHYVFFDNFDHVDYLLNHQENKPRYIPDREEFLNYSSDYYRDNDYWRKVRSFMFEVFGYSRKTSEGYVEVKNYISYGDGINELGPILDKYNLVFNGEEELGKFLNLIMLAKNNTRIWENKGYTPSELFKIQNNRSKNIINFPIQKKGKPGRNDPCSCGSGKKYKKCCAGLEKNNTAKLSPAECREFYLIWYGLMGFVNEREGVVKAKIKAEYPNKVNDMIVHKVREVVWENPELIDVYISEALLPQEEIEILKLWKTNHKKGMFFILEYRSEYALVIGQNEEGEDRLYGIRGISNSIEDILNRDLPIQVETVLLPFKGKIIYDSFISSLPVEFGKGAKVAFEDMQDKAMKHGIITSL